MTAGTDPILLDLVAAAIRRLPEDGATKSRDYGRGYAQAIRDVLGLIEHPSATGPSSPIEGDERG